MRLIATIAATLLLAGCGGSGGGGGDKSRFDIVFVRCHQYLYRKHYGADKNDMQP